MMPSVHIDKLGEMEIVKCGGRFFRNDAAFKLRDAVKSQANARVVVLDLTEMQAIGGGGLGMLLLLQRWAQDHDIRFKLFNPSGPVLDKLKHVDFEIVRTGCYVTPVDHAVEYICGSFRHFRPAPQAAESISSD